MAGTQAPRSHQRATKSSERTLKVVIRDQGRSYVWLSRQTGYSVRQISRVAAGEHAGTTKFWKLVVAALGEEVAA